MDELLRPPAEETQRRWKRLEADLAEKLEGWLTIASGAKWDKGDAKSFLYLGECKYRWAWSEHDLFYMPLDFQWLEAIWRHAQPKGKIPLLALEWGDGTRGCMVPSYHYHETINQQVAMHCDWDGRSHRLSSIDVELVACYNLKDLEIPEKHWVLFPWDDLSWLRREELEERKRIGKEFVSRFKGGRPLPKTPFPTRIKK